MPGMDGFINFNGTLEGSIAGGGGGDVTDVKVRNSQESSFESVVDEQGVAEIDLISYVRRNELTQAIENIENSIDNVEQLVDTKQNVINYSTEEQNTGIKWIDGKYIYQRSYILPNEITITNTWDWTSLEVSAENIETYIAAFAQNNSGVCWCVNCNTVNGNISMSTGRNQDTITVKTFTILYTKTTD